MQRSILKQLRMLVGNMSYDELGQLLKINKTRVFRNFNGHEMKLSEYEAIVLMIERLSGKSNESFYQTSRKALEGLSRESLVEIEVFMKRKLSLKSLINKKFNINALYRSL